LKSLLDYEIKPIPKGEKIIWWKEVNIPSEIVIILFPWDKKFAILVIVGRLVGNYHGVYIGYI
jgi:hypothetical protein